MRKRIPLLIALLLAAVLAATASTAVAGGSNQPLSIKFTNKAASGHAFAISAFGEPTGPCSVLGDLAGFPNPVQAGSTSVVNFGASCQTASQDVRIFWVTSNAGQPVYLPVTSQESPRGIINLSWQFGQLVPSWGSTDPTVPLHVASNELLCMNTPSGTATQLGIELESTTCGTTTLTIQATGSGSVASTPWGVGCGPNCTQQQFQVPIGSTWNLIASGSNGQSFNSWGPDGPCTGIDDDCMVTVMQPTEVTANFGAPSGYTVTVNQVGTGQGTITSNPPGIACTNNAGTCSALFPQPNQVELTATPATGSMLAGFDGPCGFSGNDLRTCWLFMVGNTTVDVQFNAPPTPPAPPPGPGPAPTPAPGPIPSVNPVIGPNPPGPIPTSNPGVRPALTGLGLVRSTVRAGLPGELVYRLNMNARVTLAFTDLSTPSRRYAYAFQPGKAGGDAGVNRVLLRTRVGGHPVRPGRWRVQITAVNSMGRTSTQTRVLTIR